jgi:hypothetical protein
MPITWKRLKALNGKNFRKGAVLYELSEPWEVSVDGFLTETRFIIVAVTKAASDHGLPETQCFAANSRGGFFGGFRDECDDGEEKQTHWVRKTDHESASFPYSRVVGRVDYDESLRRLTRQSYITKEERRIQEEVEERQQRERDQPWEFDCPPEFDLTMVRF